MPKITVKANASKSAALNSNAAALSSPDPSPRATPPLRICSAAVRVNQWGNTAIQPYITEVEFASTRPSPVRAEPEPLKAAPAPISIEADPRIREVKSSFDLPQRVSPPELSPQKRKRFFDSEEVQEFFASLQFEDEESLILPKERQKDLPPYLYSQYYFGYKPC